MNLRMITVLTLGGNCNGGHRSSQKKGRDGGMHRFGCEQMQTVRERGADQFGVNGRMLALYNAGPWEREPRMNHLSSCVC